MSIYLLDSPVNQRVNPRKSILKSSSSHTLDVGYQRKKSTKHLESSSNSSEEEESTRKSSVINHRFKYNKYELHDDDKEKNDTDILTVPFDEYQECNSNDKKKLINSKKCIIEIDECDNYHHSEKIKKSESQDFSVTRGDKKISNMQSINLPSVSIRDRLAALQQSGSTDWKKRVTSEPITASFIIEKPNFDNASILIYFYSFLFTSL